MGGGSWSSLHVTLRFQFCGELVQFMARGMLLDHSLCLASALQFQ